MPRSAKLSLLQTFRAQGFCAMLCLQLSTQSHLTAVMHPSSCVEQKAARACPQRVSVLKHLLRSLWADLLGLATGYGLEPSLEVLNLGIEHLEEVRNCTNLVPGRAAHRYIVRTAHKGVSQSVCVCMPEMLPLARMRFAGTAVSAVLVLSSDPRCGGAGMACAKQTRLEPSNPQAIKL